MHHTVAIGLEQAESLAHTDNIDCALLLDSCSPMNLISIHTVNQTLHVLCNAGTVGNQPNGISWEISGSGLVQTQWNCQYTFTK